MLLRRLQDLLGGIYDVSVGHDVYDFLVTPGKGGAHVAVKMTLTAPGCGMGPAIASDARARILALPGVASAEVGLVWDPPWSAEMMTPEGRKILGV